MKKIEIMQWKRLKFWNEKIDIKQWKRLKLSNEIKDLNWAIKKIEIMQWKRLTLSNEEDCIVSQPKGKKLVFSNRKVPTNIHH